MSDKLIYTKEYWTGDSRDGFLINGDGYHFFKMQSMGKILEAYEIYESDDGDEIVTPLPEMHNIDWIQDLGFENLELLDLIQREDFERVKDLANHP